MSTYGGMIARIADEIARPELAARIPEAIQSAIRYYEASRFWFNEGESTASTIIGQPNYAMPDDFVEADILTLTEADQDYRYILKRRPWHWYRGNDVNTDTTSRPGNWAYYADQIWLYPRPDQVYTLTISFLQRLATLSDYSDTNDWMTHGEELIRARAKKSLFAYRLEQEDDPAKAGMFERKVIACDQLETRSFKNLRAKSEAKIASGTLSLDPALSHGGGAFDYRSGY